LAGRVACGETALVREMLARSSSVVASDVESASACAHRAHRPVSRLRVSSL